jgi:hypothetical protein
MKVVKWIVVGIGLVTAISSCTALVMLHSMGNQVIQMMQLMR